MTVHFISPKMISFHWQVVWVSSYSCDEVGMCVGHQGLENKAMMPTVEKTQK